MRKIFVAIPSQSDAVKVATMHSIMDAQIECFARGWALEVHGYAGINPISNARNYALAQFLASDCDDLVFWDDDIACERGALVSLLGYPMDFVCGVYPYRSDVGGFPIKWIEERENLMGDRATGLLEIEGTGFGFTRLTRACVERMVAAYAHLKYPERGAPNDTAWMLFQLNVMEAGTIWSEDMLFARRWRAIGGQVWCDPDITFQHIGNKGFVGNLGDWLRARMTQERAAA